MATRRPSTVKPDDAYSDGSESPTNSAFYSVASSPASEGFASHNFVHGVQPPDGVKSRLDSAANRLAQSFRGGEPSTQDRSPSPMSDIEYASDRDYEMQTPDHWQDSVFRPQGDTNVNSLSPPDQVFSRHSKPSDSGYNSSPVQQDLLPQINGLFRLLDLYSESGSGGLVDKVIIDQDSLRSLINTILPKAYHSLTRIDFASLDRQYLKITGVYGSKSEIVRFLQSLSLVNDRVAKLLLTPDQARSNLPYLRSGLYLLFTPPGRDKPHTQCPTREAYVIYWPEDTTWDDQAIGAVRKNRVTFMRYLDRLTDQVLALISPEHGRKLVWKAQGQDDMADLGDLGFEDDVNMADSDRFFEFEVVVTKEQDEGVSSAPGFTVKDRRISLPSRHRQSETHSDLEPELVISETRQAYLIGQKCPPRTYPKYYDERLTSMALKSFLARFSSILIADSVTQEGVMVLMDDGGLHSRALIKHRDWLAEQAKIVQAIAAERRELMGKVNEEILNLKAQRVLACRAAIIQRLRSLYPFVDVDLLYNPTFGGVNVPYEDASGILRQIISSHPNLVTNLDKELKEAKLHIVASTEYKKLKKQLIADQVIPEVHTFLRKHSKGRRGSPENQEDIQDSSTWGLFSMASKAKDFVLGSAPTGPSGSTSSHFGSVKDAKEDPPFLQLMADAAVLDPKWTSVNHILELALSWAQNKIEEILPKLLLKVEEAERSIYEDRATRHLMNKEKAMIASAFRNYRSSLQHTLCKDRRVALVITEVLQDKHVFHRQIRVRAETEVREEPKINYTLQFLELTQEDRQGVKEDPNFVPTPKLCAPASFSLPADCRVIQTHLLGPSRCFLIVDSPSGISFYLSDPHALARGPPIKHLPRAGSNTIFAVDESKRLLALVMQDSQQLALQLFAFDETFSSIHSRGTPLHVTQWYQDSHPKIIKACFISGTEDLCLLEHTGRVRSFSFISQTFRPASLQLSRMPLAFFSAPDGSAVVAVEPHSVAGVQVRVFHAASFGGNPHGIVSSEEPIYIDSQQFAISSLEYRHNIHILALCPSNNTLRSITLRVSKKSTDFQYQSKNERKSKDNAKNTYHNSLIDCLADVWTRYPVIPAIKREPISAETRSPSTIHYIVDSGHYQYRPYFKQMVRAFEESTHKPAEKKLENIVVQAFDLHRLLQMTSEGALSVSSFRAGEWLVELLCLIPIHIAIARDNRFIPLNNGIIDPTVEQRLLGAEVSQIVDALNLGWYESIFNSYMATKPVKVISSMGEQSVGKSYALNHIIDSSFAGSAVRTTEGVWLSLCSTREHLIVALDFEGVHSIERTPQEDMLLVLFNTAISNMVIFRNNFALSRDVANMFTSFQSSTSLLDPASNPRLFRGLLVVVIKDVVEADKQEIVKEFRSKFTQIVSEEQGTNFITLLHGGQNLVVPWPVIQSREFYTLFSGLKVKLLRQAVTHESAGEFLLTLKTLMAKLKAQDWGALDQNLTKHRVATLTTLLPMAIFTGFGEVDPELEPLKNLENQLPIHDHGDSYERFCLSKVQAERQSVLGYLISQWRFDAARHDIAELEAHLQTLVEKRVAHVRDWLYTNTAKFPTENADVRALKRDFEDACNTLRLSVQVCGSECSSCRLPCTLSKFHERTMHECGTSHRCLDDCEFLDAHDDLGDDVSCGLPAGHIGRHMCAPAAHCCGAPCALDDKKGCQKSCMKMVDHSEEEHMCSARIHQCGKPCDLQDVQSVVGILYSCLSLCTVPHDLDHDRHACGDALSCPVVCELCPRLCSRADHFHGLDPDAIHLCGQEHPCKHLCDSPGICEINTAPRSVESTFTGVYETFQYTKYTQLARRLPCATIIAPGERDHSGDHIHTTAPDPFHFCETTCPNCGYICTLPLGHAQAEHDTAHGSMDKTAWAIEGTTDPVVEIQGRRYAPQDVGAPHMCKLVCVHQGRHAHIDYCRTLDQGPCQGDELLHIDTPMVPNPHRAKDWVSHALFWKRTGFRDPYSKDEQTEFACCDAQCAATEHEATATSAAKPSFCTLPIFHPPQPLNWTPPSGQGYVSSDGHAFSCVNPNKLRQAYHVLFVLDKSGSMSWSDRQPLINTPSSAIISQRHSNRFGAVLSALEAFWSSRNSNVTPTSARMDAYSVIFFDDSAQVSIANDFTSTPEQLLHTLIYGVAAGGGTDFNTALRLAQTTMDQHWSTDLAPVVIFLSDGECGVSESYIHDICNRAIARGKPLSFHAVSFGGPDAPSLRRMVEVCEQVGQNAPRDPLTPAPNYSFTDAIDTIRLAETFVQIAESLKKPRASLIRS